MKKLPVYLTFLIALLCVGCGKQKQTEETVRKFITAFHEEDVYAVSKIYPTLDVRNTPLSIGYTLALDTVIFENYRKLQNDTVAIDAVVRTYNLANKHEKQIAFYCVPNGESMEIVDSKGVFHHQNSKEYTYIAHSGALGDFDSFTDQQLIAQKEVVDSLYNIAAVDALKQICETLDDKVVHANKNMFGVTLKVWVKNKSTQDYEAIFCNVKYFDSNNNLIDTDSYNFPLRAGAERIYTSMGDLSSRYRYSITPSDNDVEKIMYANIKK